MLPATWKTKSARRSLSKSRRPRWLRCRRQLVRPKAAGTPARATEKPRETAPGQAICSARAMWGSSAEAELKAEAADAAFQALVEATTAMEPAEKELAPKKLCPGLRVPWAAIRSSRA